ncbi:MAG: SDR family NAD(P)-dependent oxidoreductase [Ardenticatenaceae bacterium]|nr:SDR family NAD(P)-dependent oxidoreductase [Ardenticatenaceae bacterium]
MSDRELRVFDGATAIITGGASGIGRALGGELAKRGSEVVLADLQIELAEEVASGIRDAGGKATALKLDVTDFSAVESLLREVVERTGGLDFMFNNAGITIAGPIRLHAIEDWNRIIDVNLRGVVNGVQAAYQIMLDQGFGHIVNTASTGGLVPNVISPSYTTTKYAVIGLSRVLRAEAAAEGIRVSVLCPGFVRTPMLEGGKYGKTLMDLSPEQERELRDSFEKLKPMPPDTFAGKALDAIAKNKAIIVEPSWWKLLWWIDRLSPQLTMLQLRKQVMEMNKG